MSKPGKIVCVGRNYRDHAKEMGNDVPAEPLIFLKPPSSVIGNGEAIVLPPQSSQVEHEGEIGVVIGRTLRRVTSDEARAGIQSIVAANDVTARDLQRPTHNGLAPRASTRSVRSASRRRRPPISTRSPS